MRQIESINFQVPITPLEHVKNRIRKVIQRINESTVMKVWDNMKNILDLDMPRNGGHIEHMP